MEATRLLQLNEDPDVMLRWLHSELPRLEIRADADGIGHAKGPGIISGPIVVYGDTANMGSYQERMEAGVFGNSIANPKLVANYFHRRDRPLARLGYGLTITDSPIELRGELVLPDTADGRDIAVLMGDGALLGFSAEFAPRMTRQEQSGRLRIRQSAVMTGLSVVDTPAYPLSKTEVRMDQPTRRRKLWL